MEKFCTCFVLKEVGVEKKYEISKGGREALLNSSVNPKDLLRDGASHCVKPNQQL